MNEFGEKEIKSWYPRIFRSALRMTGSEDTASDLVQQTFYKAVRSWDKFNGRSSPVTWLHSILLNCVRDWLRRKKRDPEEPFDEWRVPTTQRQRDGQIGKMIDDEILSCLRETIRELPDKLRCSFMATVIDGHTYDNAAELLGLSVGTIASRVHLARRLIKEKMRKNFPGEVYEC